MNKRRWRKAARDVMSSQDFLTDGASRGRRDEEAEYFWACVRTVRKQGPRYLALLMRLPDQTERATRETVHSGWKGSRHTSKASQVLRVRHRRASR